LIIASLDGKRLLYSAPPQRYYVAEVGVVVSNPAVLPSFTGKAVKSLLIKSNPELEKVFKEGLPDHPKPIHVTPIGYRDEKGRVIYLWKKGSDKIMVVEPDKHYFFTVAYSEEIAKAVSEALLGLNDIELFNTRWIITDLNISYTVLPSDDPPIKLDDTVAVKIMLRTPVQPIDPYRKSMYKRLNIMPGVFFSYNAGEITRMYKRGPEYWRVLDILNYVLIESKTYWKTIRQVDVQYDNKQIPALTGYVKYWVNLENTSKTEKLLVENILSHAEIMGAGSSRSIGLGHIQVKTEPRREK